MDPISLLVVAGVLSAFLTKVVQNGRTDRAYAAQGMVSPRHQERLRRLEGAGIAPRVAGEHSGAARAYLGNLWADAWLDLDARRKAKRVARKPYVYDPARPKWHQRVDAYVTGKLAALRAAYNGLAEQHRAARAEPDAGLDVVGGLDPDGLPLGAWTVGPDGEQVPLAEPAQASEQSEQEPKEEVMTEGEGVAGDPGAVSGEQHDNRGQGPASAPKRGAGSHGAGSGQPATDMQTNEDARRQFAAMAAAAAELAEAAAMAEAARAKLAALAMAGADGMAAKAFDRGAQAAAAEAADAVSLATLSQWSEAADNAGAAARAGLASLEKYRDSEDLVASEQVDPTTLAATSS